MPLGLGGDRTASAYNHDRDRTACAYNHVREGTASAYNHIRDRTAFAYSHVNEGSSRTLDPMYTSQYASILAPVQLPYSFILKTHLFNHTVHVMLNTSYSCKSIDQYMNPIISCNLFMSTQVIRMVRKQHV